MYSNTKQSIPEVFKLKMVIDQEIQNLFKIFETPRASSAHWNALTAMWKNKKERQAELRRGCEQYIARAKKEN